MRRPVSLQLPNAVGSWRYSNWLTRLRDDLLDGRSTRETVLAEKKREDRLRALGYKVVRWDWKAVTDPELLRRKLERAGITTQESPPRGLIPVELPGEWTT